MSLSKFCGARHGTHDGKGQHHGGIWQEQQTDECAKGRRSETRHEPFRRAVGRALTAIALWHVKQCNRREGARGRAPSRETGSSRSRVTHGVPDPSGYGRFALGGKRTQSGH